MGLGPKIFADLSHCEAGTNEGVSSLFLAVFLQLLKKNEEETEVLLTLQKATQQCQTHVRKSALTTRRNRNCFVVLVLFCVLSRFGVLAEMVAVVC